MARPDTTIFDAELVDSGITLPGDINADDLVLLIVYGPPHSLRGRLANRLRRLVGFNEQPEVYAVERLAPFSASAGQLVTVGLTEGGILKVHD